MMDAKRAALGVTMAMVFMLAGLGAGLVQAVVVGLILGGVVFSILDKERRPVIEDR